MRIRPLPDRLVVKRVQAKRTSPGGIVIPDTAAEKPMRGEGAAAGAKKVAPEG